VVGILKLIERKPGGIGFEFCFVEQDQNAARVAEQTWPERQEAYVMPGWAKAKQCVWIPTDPEDPKAHGWRLVVLDGDPSRIPRWRPPESEAPQLDTQTTAGIQLGLFDTEGKA